MKLSLSLACVFFFGLPSLGHGFLLTGLTSRTHKQHGSSPPSKGLYSVDYDRAPPRLDEYGLPIDPEDLRPKPQVPLKDQFYEAVDTVSQLVDTNRRREEETRQIIRQRRATAKALVVKDRVVETLDYVVHPGKAWKELVQTPLQMRQEREKQKKAEERARLEQTLQRYYAAKNRFYETLDTIESTSRTTVKVAKQVGSAVAKAPETVQSVAKVASSVGSVVSKLTGVIKKGDKDKKKDASAVSVTGKAVLEEEAAAASKPDKAKVREIWETKEKTAVRAIWEADELATPPPTPSTPSTSSSSSAPAAAVAEVEATPVAPAAVTANAPRLSFRARIDAEEERAPAAAVAEAATTPVAPAAATANAPRLSFRARIDAEEERFGARRRPKVGGEL